MSWNVTHFDIADSTNECAFRAIEAGTAEGGDVFVAREQLAGRGTRGRRWVSTRGGLFLSAILDSDRVPAPGLWTIAGGLAVHDVARSAGVAAALDWPNDVVSANGAKLAGILAESRHTSGPGPHRFVLGIGVNVERSPDPNAVEDRLVSSLSTEGAALSVEAAEAQTLAALAVRVDEARTEPVSTFRDYFTRCLQATREVEVQVAGQTVRGTFDDIDPERGIRLSTAGGDVRWISLAYVRAIRCIGDGHG